MATDAKPGWNWLLWAGFVLSVIAFLSYFAFFVEFPSTRNFPWANLLLFAIAAGLLAAGIRRAFRRPQSYRGQDIWPDPSRPKHVDIGFLRICDFCCRPA